MEKIVGQEAWLSTLLRLSIRVSMSMMVSVTPTKAPLLMHILYSIILDGEMLVWDPVSERNLPFGTLKTAALGMLDL